MLVLIALKIGPNVFFSCHCKCLNSRYQSPWICYAPEWPARNVLVTVVLILPLQNCKIVVTLCHAVTYGTNERLMFSDLHSIIYFCIYVQCITYFAVFCSITCSIVYTQFNQLYYRNIILHCQSSKDCQGPNLRMAFRTSANPGKLFQFPGNSFPECWWCVSLCCDAFPAQRNVHKSGGIGVDWEITGTSLSGILLGLIPFNIQYIQWCIQWNSLDMSIFWITGTPIFLTITWRSLLRSSAWTQLVTNAAHNTEMWIRESWVGLGRSGSRRATIGQWLVWYVIGLVVSMHIIRSWSRRRRGIRAT